MQYVAIARHTADNCPSSSATIRDQAAQLPPKLEESGKKHKVNLQNVQILSPSHVMVLTFEAQGVEAVRDFIEDVGLQQWNEIDLNPSQSIQEAMQDLATLPPPIW